MNPPLGRVGFVWGWEPSFMLLLSCAICCMRLAYCYHGHWLSRLLHKHIECRSTAWFASLTTDYRTQNSHAKIL